MRRPIVAGNWKMNKTESEATLLVNTLMVELSSCTGVDMVVCPPLTSLKTVSGLIGNTPIKMGAQNMHWECSGAYTGEVSAPMLRELSCTYILIGHSERREYFHETDAEVQLKVRTALSQDLVPIVCVGETLEQREQGQTESVIHKQITEGLVGFNENEIQHIILAYEPVWAIGTGKTATPAQAQEVHAFIRQLLKESWSDSLAESVRIQYGGSVKSSNAKELFGQKDIDGGLIGGASLEAQSFIEIVQASV